MAPHFQNSAQLVENDDVNVVLPAALIVDIVIPLLRLLCHSRSSFDIETAFVIPGPPQQSD
jgi:hypothetical protein